jgi:hypothetical protein
VQEASRRDGTSAAQFVREATAARVAVEDYGTVLRRDVAGALGRLDRRLRLVEETLRRHGLR